MGRVPFSHFKQVKKQFLVDDKNFPFLKKIINIVRQSFHISMGFFNHIHYKLSLFFLKKYLCDEWEWAWKIMIFLKNILISNPREVWKKLKIMPLPGSTQISFFEFYFPLSKFYYFLILINFLYF